METMDLVHTEANVDILWKEGLCCILRSQQISNGKYGFRAYRGHCGYLMEIMGLLHTEVTADI